MRNLFTALVISVLLGSICTFTACTQPVINVPTVADDGYKEPAKLVVETDDVGSVVDIEIRSNGMASYHGSVNVTDFHENGRAEATYAIYNNTPNTVKPMIEIDANADVANFEDAYDKGYVKSPYYVYDWVELPKTETIKPYETKYFTVAIEMPQGATIEHDKYAYATMVYCQSKKTLIMAVDTWWLIDMKDY